MKRLDASDIANAGSFLTRQLLHRLPAVYSKKYAKMWAEEDSSILPAFSTLQPGEIAVTEEIFESKGEAVELADWSGDIPTLSSSVKETDFNVHEFAVGYSYTVQQLHAMAAGKRDFSAKRIEERDRALRTKVHELLVFGSKKRGSTGLFNHPGVPISAASYNPNTATWADHLNFCATAISDVQDRNVLTEDISTILIPNKLLTKLNTTYQAGDSGKSAREAIEASYAIRFVAQNECRSEILEKYGVHTAGQNQDRIVFLPRDPMCFERVYYPTMNMPPQLHGLEYRVISYVGTSQTIVHAPESMLYATVAKVL